MSIWRIYKLHSPTESSEFEIVPKEGLFVQKRIKYLGHIILTDEPSPDKDWQKLLRDEEEIPGRGSKLGTLYDQQRPWRIDHASVEWLFRFKNPKKQLAGWFERLQEYDFSLQPELASYTRTAARQKLSCEMPTCLTWRGRELVWTRISRGAALRWSHSTAVRSFKTTFLNVLEKDLQAI